MPATEKTWRDLKWLHVVFGFSSLALFITTVWMFAADHDREWKKYQRSYRGVEKRLSQWRLNEELADHRALFDDLENRLAEARLEAPSATVYERFLEAAGGEARGQQVVAPELARTSMLLERLRTACSDAQQKRQEANQAEEVATQAARDVTTARANLLGLSRPSPADRAAAEAAVRSAQQVATAARQAVTDAMAAATQATEDALDLRREFIGRLQRIVNAARVREDDLLSRRKFRQADYDAARADLDILVRDARSDVEIEQMQGQIDAIKNELDRLTQQRQDASRHRQTLQQILNDITATEEALAQQLENDRAELDRLANSIEEREVTYFTSSFPFLGKKLLELPILDAFNSPLKIDNLWTKNLTIPYGSFGEVRRFDRCTTCHRGIDKAEPGTAATPLYVPARQVKLVLRTPDEKPPPDVDGQGNELPLSLEAIYGVRLTDRDLLGRREITVDYVQPGSLGAVAHRAAGPGNELESGDGFQVGDVLLYVNADKVSTLAEAYEYLVDGARWGETFTVTVRRGVPQPFASHPRLDLFVGSTSPHQLTVFACTSCHEGQGSATSFKFASHTPDSPAVAHKWRTEYGWFDNPHWIFPMFPRRFAESACLKCHHDVVELGPSRRFPDPPAPKLMAGFDLVKTYGCFGCHEMNGYAGSDRRVGPDLRLEPNYFAAAAALQADASFSRLDAEVQNWVHALIQHPERSDIRHKLRSFLLADARQESPLVRSGEKLADVLQDIEVPGTQRRVGPSLRYVAHKLGAPFLYDWIREPKHFRPSTQMPQFFGLWDHLEDDDRAHSERLERIEILGILHYLLERSQPFQYIVADRPSAPPSAERGKLAFELRGCLACHQHRDFPYATATQGPDLSGMGDKLASTAGAPNGRAWLYSWLKDPTHYHARTKMPNLILDPYEEGEKTIDPAADIAAYLLASSTGWKPGESAARLTPDTADLDELAIAYLTTAFPIREAESYLKEGIPEHLRGSLKGAEVELVGGADLDRKLLFIGSKSIAKYGCFGCHDIPGFEDARPVGTALADWGRKESARLAFEHITEYLHAQDNHASPRQAALGVPGADADSHRAPSTEDDGFDESYYRQQLEAAQRSGFIWQKLKEPRSYDYKKTKNKSYNERLRMPQFAFSNQQREAIITFVLGLVAEPPAEEFVYHGMPARNAIARGEGVIDKYNCTGCHMVEAEEWELEFEPGEFGAQGSPPDYPFLATDFRPEDIERSAVPDPRRGVLRATIRGMPLISNDDAKQEIWDEEGDPIEEDVEYDPDTLLYPFDLWQPALVAGHVYEVGVKPMIVPAATLKNKRPPQGGDLTLWLLERVLQEEKKANPSANGTEVWGWLPPPLIAEGRKVQTEWLHDFLLDPFPIRPAVFLRMPRFNMSSDEATDLVNYFAAKENVDFPFELNERTRQSHLEASETAFSRKGNGGGRLDHAMKIIADVSYCTKCHLVADFVPEGSPRALAPDLAIGQYRLRPDFLRRWLANPKKVLPYTSMPVNLPFNPDDPHLGGVPQELFPGTSIEQVDALVDLIMNFGPFLSRKSSVADLVEASKPAAAGTDAQNAGETGAAATP
jgi:cytochrome c2